VQWLCASVGLNRSGVSWSHSTGDKLDGLKVEFNFRLGYWEGNIRIVGQILISAFYCSIFFLCQVCCLDLLLAVHKPPSVLCWVLVKPNIYPGRF
jgi:hypothetical protein